jgi:hypothetical protein
MCNTRQIALTSIIIPLGRHLRFYVINFRKLIIDTDTKSLLLLRMADITKMTLTFSRIIDFDDATNPLTFRFVL